MGRFYVSEHICSDTHHLSARTEEKFGVCPIRSYGTRWSSWGIVDSRGHYSIDGVQMAFYGAVSSAVAEHLQFLITLIVI